MQQVKALNKVIPCKLFWHVSSETSKKHEYGGTKHKVAKIKLPASSAFWLNMNDQIISINCIRTLYLKEFSHRSTWGLGSDIFSLYSLLRFAFVGRSLPPLCAHWYMRLCYTTSPSCLRHVAFTVAIFCDLAHAQHLLRLCFWAHLANK